MVGEACSLIVLVFHSLLDDRGKASSSLLHPELSIEVSNVRQLVDHFTRSGYEFVSPTQLADGLPRGKYCLLTLDDGYSNNHHILPILETYDIPAILFVSTKHVLENQCFWWDVVSRRRAEEGIPWPQVQAEINALETLRHDTITTEVRNCFGANALTPLGDLDRPFSPAELQEFASHRLVHLGNHTGNHALLTNYDQRGVRQQSREAQHDIAELTGVRPRAISYPRGLVTDQIVEIARDEGLEMGFTVQSVKNSIPLNSNGHRQMMLGRFILDNRHSVAEQCVAFRSDVRMLARLNRLCQKLIRPRLMSPLGWQRPKQRTPKWPSEKLSMH